MAQNRKPPSYQEYSASMLANRNFRLMSLVERGLLYTLKMECWENVTAPSNPNELAKVIGADVEEVNKSLTTRVKSFFTESAGSFTNPELEDYRKHLADRKAAQSEGGKKGSKITNNQLGRGESNASTSSSKLRATRQGSVESLVQSSSDKLSQEQSLDKEIIIDTFAQDYEDYEAGDYYAASNGR